MSQSLEAIDPRTGRIDCRLVATDPAAVAGIATKLRQQQPIWAQDLEHRVATLLEWRQALLMHGKAMVQALVADTGRHMLSQLELHGMAQRIQYWADRAPTLLVEGERQRSATANNVTYQHQRVPYPLVGVISPWNFPLTLSLVDTIPALFAGSAVLLKPSEVTPRFAEVLNATLAEVPDLHGVFSVVQGGGDVGEALIDTVDMICFTGSVPTGRKVAVRAAERFIPACLELGGKDPAIVLEDADIDLAADALLRSAAGSCGQACMSIERIYAHDSCMAPLIDALVSKADAQQFNTPDMGRGTLYPFIDQRQAHKVAAQLADAIEQGAVLHCGGAPENIGGGFWMRPTVLSQINHDMLLMREETFGPLLPVMAFSTDEQGIALANDSQYGLSGSVFGEPDHAIAVAKALNVGAVGINDASMTALIHDVEKQSFGFSGLGPSRMGDAGLLRFFRTKAIMQQHDRAAPLAVLDESGALT